MHYILQGWLPVYFQLLFPHEPMGWTWGLRGPTEAAVLLATVHCRGRTWVLIPAREREAPGGVREPSRRQLPGALSQRGHGEHCFLQLQHATALAASPPRGAHLGPGVQSCHWGSIAGLTDRPRGRPLVSRPGRVGADGVWPQAPVMDHMVRLRVVWGPQVNQHAFVKQDHPGPREYGPGTEDTARSFLGKVKFFYYASFFTFIYMEFSETVSKDSFNSFRVWLLSPIVLPISAFFLLCSWKGYTTVYKSHRLFKELPLSLSLIVIH